MKVLSVIIPVYKNSAGAATLATHLVAQRLPSGYELEIIAVDDGSADGTYSRLTTVAIRGLTVFQLEKNGGRGAACNHGVMQARGQILVFVDSDCFPGDRDWLARHVAAVVGEFVASCGPIEGHEAGFWGRYHEAASRRRERQHRAGASYAGTTANFAVLTTVFRDVGGFDEDYRHYGFEDRDLLIRLAKKGRIAWTNNAPVQHRDELTLSGVLSKLQRAGGPSASKFSVDHPDAYKTLGFRMLDTRCHGWLRLIGWLATPVLRLAKYCDTMLESRWMPYWLGAGVVKVMSALAFIIGTMAKEN